MFLARSFQEFGVATSYLRVLPGVASAGALIMVEPSGEKALLYAPINPQPLDLPLLEEALARSRVVYATPYDVVEFETVSQLARTRNTCVAIDLEALAVPGRSELDAWMRLADVVFLNEHAYRLSTGESPTIESMRGLLQFGPSVIVVTRGSAGALVTTTTVQVEQAAYPADAVDTTGAGDCFAAAFLAHCLDGYTLQNSVRFACAAASLAVMKVGARTGFPDRLAVEQLLSFGDEVGITTNHKNSKDGNVC
jgi:sugar/nucleoside kinase (ribokinase family)